MEKSKLTLRSLKCTKKERNSTPAFLMTPVISYALAFIYFKACAHLCLCACE